MRGDSPTIYNLSYLEKLRNKLSNLYNELFYGITEGLKSENNKLRDKIIRLKFADKVVIVQPTIEVRGLGKLKKALFLDGKYLQIQGNYFNITTKNKAPFHLEADNSVVSDNVFEFKKPKK